MNIYEKMSAITDEITKVAKNLEVGVGKNSYKAVGESDVLQAVKPLENKYKVYSYPVNRKVVESRVLTSKSTYQGQEQEKNQLWMRIETTYRFVNIEKPDEYIEVVTYGDGVDPQDKASGKAMTYADKYALLKAYKIETGDDPDQNASQPLVKKTNPNAPTSEQVAELKKYNRTVEHVARANGVTADKVTAEQVASYLKKCEDFVKSQKAVEQESAEVFQ